MKPNLFYSILIGSVLLLTVSGCRRTPAPVVNPPGVETSLAATALALAKQTEAANPFTATPPVTLTATFTPTPKISINGTSLGKMEDQSTLFIDHKAGIQLLIPAGWMPLRVNEDEYYQAFTSDVAAANPALSQRLTQIQDVDLNTFRLDVIDIREGHTSNGILSDINILFYAGDTRSLEQWAQAEGKKKSPYKNYLFLNRGYLKRADGTRTLVIDRSWTQDQSKKVSQRSVFVPLSTGMLVLDLYSDKDFKDTVLPDFEQVLESITPLNP
jgi:hypothetical protein